MTERESVLDEALRMNPGADGFHFINVHQEFLDGTLYVVGFNKDEKPKLNYVYVDDMGIHLRQNEALLVSLVSEKRRKRSIIDTLGGVAGIIALAITGVIIYLLIDDPRYEIPQVLSASLTTILGFYFGSMTVKR